jgi:hypothetical protein
VSDVVVKGELPEKLQQDAEMYAGCVSGAIDMDKYVGIIREQGFQKIEIHKQKEIVMPVEILKEYLTDKEILQFKNKEIGIFSITISGAKISG